MKMSDLAGISDSRLKRMLIEQLTANPGLRRKELLERCIEQMPFTPEELENRSTASVVVRAKSRMGMLLSYLIENGDIEQDPVGELTAVSTAGAVIEWDMAADFVMEILRDDKPTAKKQIFSLAERRFGTDETPGLDDDNNLHALLGNVLARLEKQRVIIKQDAGYILPEHTTLPQSELGSYLQAARTGDDVRDCFLRAIHVKGGEWFELYAVRLMVKYYERCRYNVLSASVTGGSEDGGIDGIIETQDWIGFRERILMQMKNKQTSIPPKEVREFYGAVCAENGSRGLFVTTSKFHREAMALIDKVDNLMGIDGEKLCDIALLCGFGLTEHDGQLAIDESIFLEQ